MFMGDIFLRLIFAEEFETPFPIYLLTSEDRELPIEEHVEFLNSNPEDSLCYKMSELMYDNKD